MYIYVENGVVVETGLNVEKIRQRLRKKNISPSTVSSDFTEYGYHPVQNTSIPDADVVEKADPVLVDGVWKQHWVSRDFTPEEAQENFDGKKNGKKIAITTKRKEIESNHPVFDTSPGSQQRLAALWIAMQKNPARVVNFKGKNGVWTDLNKAEVENIAETVITWVQACFNREKELIDAVNACTTQAELDAIDINTGWPA